MPNMSTRAGRRGHTVSSSPTNNIQSALPHSRPKNLRSGPTSPAILPVHSSKLPHHNNQNHNRQRNTYAAPRRKASEQRHPHPALHPQSHAQEGSDESDLTPEPSELEAGAEEDDDIQETSMSGRAAKKEKNKEKANHSPTQAHAHGAEDQEEKGKKEKRQSLTAAGPEGRDRKRTIKLAEEARRRARDAKFDLEGGNYKSLASSSKSMSPEDDDDESSYGDDESGEDDEENPAHGLPLDLVGQDIEDLGYGNGKTHMELKREMRNAPPDAENEDEEMAISDLSGSEAGHQSVSEEDVSMSDDESSASDEDVVDEYGLPIPGSGYTPPEGPLILMENWNGEFVLVQPKQERARDRHGSRRRNSLGSKTNASMDDRSTVMSTAGEALIVDPDAAFDQDNDLLGDGDADNDEEGDGEEGDSVSSWSDLSGMSDGGDTTDSMEEEDMPLLDSPALDQMITDPLASIAMGLAVNGSSSTATIGTPIDGMNPAGMLASLGATPSIVVTDMSGEYLNALDMGTGELAGEVMGDPNLDITAEPSIFSTASVTSSLPGTMAPPATVPIPPPAPASVAGPSSPSTLVGSGSSLDVSTAQNGTVNVHINGTPAMPKMGTFHPTRSHPAQHAIIDGSKTATKSPFTHRRRSRGAQSIISAQDTPLPFSAGKRKNSSGGTPTPGGSGMNGIHASPFEPFSPSPSTVTYSQPRSTAIPRKVATPHTLPKKARYSSIPGHPRYIAARQRQLDDAECERESTPSPSDDEYGDQQEDSVGAGLSLEDMVETSFFHSHPHNGTASAVEDGTGDEDGIGFGFRFDRVPVGTYLRRNFNGDAAGSPGHARGRKHHGPAHGHGHGHGHPNGHYGPLGATLLGRAGVSPILAPEVMMEGKRKRGRRMPALQI